jgi:galactokinase
MMRPIEQQAVNAFRDRFGQDPDVVASAPGRVNLIGEHVDYSGGFVLPCAVDARVAVALSGGPGEIYSVDFGEARPSVGKDGTWADYPRGVAWSLGDAGFSTGPFHAAIVGDVPVGAGLSSSAAIEAATAVALVERFHLTIPLARLALICQRAENAFVGVNCGIMDQYASLLCQEGAALLVDCRSLDAESVPLDLAAAGLDLVVCDTRVPRNLAGTGYNERRAMTEEAARVIGVPQLRDATTADLAKLSGVMLKRARHVVTEDDRVLAAVAALRLGDFVTFGQLMYQSHASLRDDFEVSVPQLDTFVEVAAQSGALGARLTGAGFGGCAIAIIASNQSAALATETSRAFDANGWVPPVFYHFRPSAGAGLADRSS